MRTDQYTSQNKVVTRTELPGQPLEIYERQGKPVWYQNKERTTRVIQWVGLHNLYNGERDILVNLSTILDSGPAGVRVVFSEPPAVEPTQEERDYNRKALQRVAAQAMYDQGLW